jgi:hypothetical protein
MRSFVLPIVVVTVAAALVTPASASGQAPAGDSVVGDQSDLEVLFFFHIDATSGPAGENPAGTVTMQSGGGNAPFFSFTVTCLSVSGSTAIIGVGGTVFGFGTQLPARGLIRVVDAGGPSSGLDTIETAGELGSEGGPPLPGPTTCSAFPGPFALPTPLPEGPVTSDIVVHDEPAVPTSKEQCRNGGWRNFPGFKNQGHCVAFVERGPKP